MFQASMFSNAFKDQRFLSSGCMARVNAIGDTGWVHKYARERDGTCNYLEWCIAETAAGRKLAAMPEIDLLVHTEAGYIVVMRQYFEYGNERCTPLQNDDVLECVEAYKEYMTATFGFGWYADDVHRGNVMARTDGTIVLTDPCVAGYRDKPVVDNFVLQ